jgi:hypothetical protein
MIHQAMESATVRRRLYNEGLSLPVQLLMAGGAKGNQIEIVIRALLAAKLLVMDLQVLPRTTDLALPAIAT